MSKTIIHNANIVTSSKSFIGDILISGDKIEKVGNNIDPENAKIIDAEGLLALPGGVDAHTHFDLDVGFTRASDNFYTGTIAAAMGGTTTIIDHMAFGPKGCDLMHQPKIYEELTKESIIDYGLHGVIQHVNDDVLSDMSKLKATGITSVKIYSTYDYKLLDNEAYSVLKRAKELDMVVCAHCEDHQTLSKLRDDFLREGKTQPKYHPLSRPAEAEAQSVARFLDLSKQAGGTKVLVVHLTSALALNEVEKARRKGGENINAETCPQYIYLDDSLYNDDEEGLKYIMSPPLRKQHDMDTILNAVFSGDINTVGTDHCPFFFATQKQRGKDNFTLCPGGAPGVELRMPLMINKAIELGADALVKTVQVCCYNPAKLFGLSGKKGDIASGYDADIALIDPNKKWTITKSLLHENVDYTPYEGIEIKGAVIMTMSRGEIIAENGEFTGVPGRGNFLRR